MKTQYLSILATLAVIIFAGQVEADNKKGSIFDSSDTGNGSLDDRIRELNELNAKNPNFQSVKIPIKGPTGKETVSARCIWQLKDFNGPSEIILSDLNDKLTCDYKICDGMIHCAGGINGSKLIACSTDKETGKCPKSIQKCLDDTTVTMNIDNGLERTMPTQNSSSPTPRTKEATNK